MILYCPDCKLVKKLKDIEPVKTIQRPDIPNIDNHGKWIQLICTNPEHVNYMCERDYRLFVERQNGKR